MRGRIILLVAVGALCVGGFAVTMLLNGRGSPDAGASSNKIGSGGIAPGSYSRIVSLAPSITELLFALGLGGNVVGRTEYCDYPPEAKSIPAVGGYLDPNYEAIVKLKPDLVLLLEEHQEARKNLTACKLQVFSVDHRTIIGIMDSIDTIGTLCGRGQQAIKIMSDIQARTGAIRKKTEPLPRRRVMVSIGRSVGVGSPKDVCIAGKEGFYDAMIDIAGGQNVYQGSAVKFPIVSGEGIVKMNPEVIIDLVDNLDKIQGGKDALLKDWSQFGDVDAVRNGRVCVLTGSHLMRPGPRFILIVEDLAKVIHPEVDWAK